MEINLIGYSLSLRTDTILVINATAHCYEIWCIDSGHKFILDNAFECLK